MRWLVSPPSVPAPQPLQPSPLPRTVVKPKPRIFPASESARIPHLHAPTLPHLHAARNPTPVPRPAPRVLRARCAANLHAIALLRRPPSTPHQPPSDAPRPLHFQALTSPHLQKRTQSAPSPGTQAFCTRVVILILPALPFASRTSMLIADPQPCHTRGFPCLPSHAPSHTFL